MLSVFLYKVETIKLFTKMEGVLMLYWCALCKKFLGEEKQPGQFHGTYVDGRPVAICKACHNVLMQKKMDRNT